MKLVLYDFEFGTWHLVFLPSLYSWYLTKSKISAWNYHQFFILCNIRIETNRPKWFSSKRQFHIKWVRWVRRQCYIEQYPKISTCYDIYTHVKINLMQLTHARQYSVLIMLQVILIHSNGYIIIAYMMWMSQNRAGILELFWAYLLFFLSFGLFVIFHSFHTPLMPSVLFMLSFHCIVFEKVHRCPWHVYTQNDFIEKYTHITWW